MAFGDFLEDVFNPVGAIVKATTSILGPHPAAPPPAPVSAALPMPAAVAPIASPTYVGAGTHDALASSVEEQHQLQRMTVENRRAFEKIMKEEKRLTADLSATMRHAHEAWSVAHTAEYRLSEYERKVPLMLREVMSRAAERIFVPAREHLGKFIKDDPFLRAKEAERLERELHDADFAKAKSVIKEWMAKRRSISERLMAGGLPMVSGTVLSYLSNSGGGFGSPDLRLGFILSVVGAALFGRDAEAWTVAAIVPAIEWFGSFVSVPLGFIAGPINCSNIPANSLLSVQLAPMPTVFTSSNTTVTLDPATSFLMEFTPAGVVILHAISAVSGSLSLSGASQTITATYSDAMTSGDNVIAALSFIIGSGSSATRVTLNSAFIAH